MRVPGQVPTITASMSAASVVIAWDEPFTGGQGIVITSYTIELQDTAGVVAPAPLLCDGTSTAVVNSRSCQIAMADLTATPAYGSDGANSGGLGLTQDQLIVARVAATNSKGTGPFSVLNTAGI